MRTILLIAFAIAAMSCDDGIPVLTQGGSLNPPDEDPRPIILPAPVLSVGVGIETGDYYLHWTNVPGADTYTLQSCSVESFPAPSVVYIGPNRNIGPVEPTFGGFPLYYRVKAEDFSGRSPWSNVVRLP